MCPQFIPPPPLPSKSERHVENRALAHAHSFKRSDWPAAHPVGCPNPHCHVRPLSAGVRAQLVDFSAQKKRPRSPRLHRAHSGAQSTLSFAPSGSLSIAGPSPKRPRLDDAAGGAGGAGFGGSRAERPRAQEGRGWDGAGESTSGSGGGRGSGAASGAGLFGRDPESEEGSLLRKGTEEDHSKLVEWLWRRARGFPHPLQSLRCDRLNPVCDACGPFSSLLSASLLIAPHRHVRSQMHQRVARSQNHCVHVASQSLPFLSLFPAVSVAGTSQRTWMGSHCP